MKGSPYIPPAPSPEQRRFIVRMFGRGTPAANDNKWPEPTPEAVAAWQAELTAREPDEAMRRAFIEWVEPFDPDEIPY